MAMDLVVLPSTGPRPGSKRVATRSDMALIRMKNLEYDPIGELVNAHKKIMGEIARQEKIRDGAIVELRLDGKPKAYRPDFHLALYDKVINIGNTLLRYKYGRVPEGDSSTDKPPMPLIVNLTKKGETYVVNNEHPEQQPEDDDVDDWVSGGGRELP
jgi:hypothetical protein